MENLLVLLICFGVLAAVIVLWVRRTGARRGLIKPPLPEKPPMTERATPLPKPPPVLDAAVVAAIASAVHAIAPGARITQIEEEFQVMESS